MEKGPFLAKLSHHPIQRTLEIGAFLLGLEFQIELRAGLPTIRQVELVFDHQRKSRGKRQLEGLVPPGDVRQGTSQSPGVFDQPSGG